MAKKEKIYVAITLILVLVMITKAVFLDEVRNLNPDEAKFKQFVEKVVVEKYSGFLRDNGIVTYKVVDIKKISDEGSSVIQYKEPGQDQYVIGEIPGKYQAKVRGYFLRMIPYKEFKVATNTK